MLTYSLNISTPTEATTYNLIGATSTDLSAVLSDLHDNTNKEITPSIVRNSILTLYANSIFKQTKPAFISYEYIGIDTGNSSNPDLKNKIYLGKRSFSNSDIMNSSLLNSDVDVFLFNTKRDTVQNNSTKVSILAGTNSNLWQRSPYIESQIITGTSTLSLDIVNASTTGGDLNIYSGKYTTSTGTVSLSNIVFPSFSDSYGLSLGLTGAASGRVLVWDNNRLIWNDLTLPSISVIGATGTPTYMYGTPVYLNNYPLEFSDNRHTPLPIGDINIGETFSMVEMVEVLRRIVYTYLPPLCSVSILPPYASGYVEIGTSPLVKLKYTITKRTLSTQTTGLTSMIPTSYPAITSSGQVTVSGTASGIVISPVGNTTTTFTVTASDGTESTISSTFLSGIYPYFYGFSSLTTMNTAGLSSLTKLVEPIGDKIVDVTGSGNLYFIYDAIYPPLTQVLDNFNNPMSLSFTTITLSSPTGLWASKQFKVYKWSGIPQVGPPSVNYQFKY